MSKASIKDSIVASREQLLANPQEARSRDAVAAATVEGGLRCIVKGPQGQEPVSDMTKGHTILSM